MFKLPSVSVGMARCEALSGLMSLLVVLSALFFGAAHAADDFLEPEKAFRFSARMLDAKTAEVSYVIADGYYMYRERFAVKAEFEDLDGREPLWRIPAERMKMGREHLVPLSVQAAEIAKRAIASSPTEFLFPGTTPEKPMSENTMIYALYRLGQDPTSYARDFFDVNSLDLTTGLPASNGLYTTGPGWDYVTGFGTPKVSGLICDLDGKC